MVLLNTALANCHSNFSPNPSHRPIDALQICIWNVDTGQVEGKISHSGEDQLTSVSWSPDGAKISCGGKSGQFYQCDTKGVVLDSWEGIRVVGLHYRRDGKSVLAADTHHRIRSYNFDELSDASVSTDSHCNIARTFLGLVKVGERVRMVELVSSPGSS